MHSRSNVILRPFNEVQSVVVGGVYAEHVTARLAHRQVVVGGAEGHGGRLKLDGLLVQDGAAAH